MKRLKRLQYLSSHKAHYSSINHGVIAAIRTSPLYRLLLIFPMGEHHSQYYSVTSLLTGKMRSMRVLL